MGDSRADFRTIWLKEQDDTIVQIIDQRRLPHEYVVADLSSYRDGVHAIKEMLVRGAPLIGATAAWSLYLAALEAESSSGPLSFMREAAAELAATRPTAVNLQWAIDRVLAVIKNAGNTSLSSLLRREAEAICEEEGDISREIGLHGLAIIEAAAAKKPGEAVNILTHCNAGALATITLGTATAPIYMAHANGIPLHIWVDETRPRNQGSQLTAWELQQRGVPHTLITDNAGGHLMQHGHVDLCITGTDRTTRCGDVANKIGTYLKALAANDNNIPFYVALPSTTIDWTIRDGVRAIPIEERDAREVSHVVGMVDGERKEVCTIANGTPVRNLSFDVTPARLITGLITERGVCAASEAGLLALFPEYE